MSDKLSHCSVNDAATVARVMMLLYVGNVAGGFVLRKCELRQLYLPGRIVTFPFLLRVCMAGT